ncbi:homoserine O-acetyltransferase [uncultured Rhodoblastus sp.]|uniref:E22 family MetX-like putative esterase n=1 Tax=uncultured Rhodoblastus sp. TaxID=543037 RepID=UPI0025EE12AE|nr:homoserine O-acetyltransferase [uncultured Rhodoblastus sp.]
MADEILAVKQRFELARLRTLGGATLENVAVGYETYGALDAARENAILVAHFFSGSSHAAGRYAPDDPLPGYWDAIIGPGKAVDTNRWFVISVDTLVNLNFHNPKVVTTGPASINPATGKPYGLRFPAVGIGDFIRVQKALLDHLGIERLHAVMGPSMGGLQTFDWAATYPECVGRIVPTIAAPTFGGWLTAWLSMWAQPIKLDPAWRGGDYYDGPPPRAGLEASLRLVTLHALHSDWADGPGGGRALAPGGDPADVAATPFAVEQRVAEIASARLDAADANHLLYLVRANQTYLPGAGAGAKTVVEGLSRIKAPTLMLYAPEDQVFRPEWIQDTAAVLRVNGVHVETGEIHGPNGHYNGILHIETVAPQIAEFLARKF